MVAYSFQERFVDDIRSGRKRQTIRAVGHRRHARVGDALQLYCKMRHPDCFKIVEKDPGCVGVDPIMIKLDPRGLMMAVGEHPGPFYRVSDHFAKQDGFENPQDMQTFWIEKNGLRLGQLFSGLVISWRLS